MRILPVSRLILIAFVAVSLFSCTEKEEFTSEKISTYLPLTTGKYITYRLDSLVFTQFDRVAEIHKYQVKHVVDAQITDNLGRPSYRIYRFIRDSVNATSWTPAQPWTPAGSYFITELSDQLEVVEDNLRFIKMHLPIKDGFSWKGNRYLPTDPYGSKYFFSNDDNMESWDFYYDGEPTSFSYRNVNYADVQTVEQEDEIFNIPVTLPTAYGSKSRSVEKYSKNIGLVFREYTLYEYQPDPVPGGPNYAYRGFGITMWMIDHN
jgi:hypothetical protein